MILSYKKIGTYIKIVKKENVQIIIKIEIYNYNIKNYESSVIIIETSNSHKGVSVDTSTTKMGSGY